MDTTRLVVAVGFWVQGFRCLPWMAVSFFLKDGLGVTASSMQLLQNSANLPMVAKPLYGLVSDAIYIRGQHRLPYVAIGALLQALSWLAIALLPESFIHLFTISLFLLLSNLGASIAEVANDAIIAEADKNSQSTSSGQLQSYAWICASSAGALGNLIGGISINHLHPGSIFLLFGFLLLLQFFTTIVISENSLNITQKLDHSLKTSSIRKQISELSVALCKPEISGPIAWFSASYALVPLLLSTMFYYQTQYLNLDSSVIGFSKVFGQAGVLAWSIAYNKLFNKTPARKLLLVLQTTIALFMMSDAFFVKGFYRKMGMPDSVYVVIFSGFLEALFQFKMLPFSVHMAQLCPAGCEGSVMAFVMAATALATIISGYLGVALAALVGVSGNDFSGLTTGIVIQAACTLVPLCFVSWIPPTVLPEKKEE